MVLARSVPGRDSLAILSGSAINQDGRSSGLTAPNGPSQAALLREALRLAAPAADLGFVAVHGTGASPRAFPQSSTECMPHRSSTAGT